MNYMDNVHEDQFAGRLNSRPFLCISANIFLGFTNVSDRVTTILQYS